MTALPPSEPVTEFAVILRETDEATVKASLETLEEGIRKYNLDCEPKLSISYGYAFRRSTDVSLEELFDQADQAMYVSKQAKRNARTYSAKPSEESEARS